MAQSTSVHATVLSRRSVVASVATNQKNTTALMYWLVNTSTLPPAQYETGTVMTAHPTSSSATPISPLNGGADSRRTIRSMRWAPIAIAAATNAMRNWPSIGNHACGDNRRMAVKATSARNATVLAVDPGLAGLARLFAPEVIRLKPDSTGCGRHQATVRAVGEVFTGGLWSGGGYLDQPARVRGPWRGHAARRARRDRVPLAPDGAPAPRPDRTARCRSWRT